jgi:sugar lactone lactonase YvrE
MRRGGLLGAGVTGILTSWLTVAMAAGPGATSAAPAVDWRFGVVESLANPTAAQTLGVGWTRVPLFWNALEPAPGAYNTAYTNQDRTYLELAGSGEGLVGVVEGAPPWAEIVPRSGVMTAPRGLLLPWNNPDNLWGQFMYRLAKHYTGLINTWIIGNEISIHDGAYETWAGTLPQFARLLEVAYEAVHAANPAAHVLAPGEPYWYGDGQTTAALLNLLSALPGAAAHHDYLDGLNLHLYNTIQYNAQIYGYYQGLLRQHGLSGLPIWLTEANVAPATPSLPTGAPPVVQASFLVEDFASSFRWATRVEAYKLMDDRPPGRFQYGLLTDSGQRRLVFTAYRTFIRIMRGATWMGQQLWTLERGYPTPSTPALVTWGAPGRLIQIVWDQGFRATTAVLAAHASSALVVSVTGAVRTVHAAHGVFRIALDPATYNPSHSFQATIGGPPVYVIQSVPLGADGTPTTWNVGTPDGFPADPTDRWTVLPSTWTATRGSERVAVNPAGDQVVIQDGTATHWITQAGTGANALNTPVAAAIGPDGSVYVANLGNSDVLRFLPSGQWLGTFGGYGTGPGRLLGAAGVTVTPDGTVYVVDAGAQSIAAYSSTGRFLRAFGGWGTGPGRFDGPSAIAAGPHGTVYVADALNNRVQAFGPDGRFLNQVATPDPVALTVTASGQLTALDGLTDATDPLTFPHPLPSLPAPAHATAVAFSSDGLYAVATNDGTIVVYRDAGGLVGRWTIPPAYGNREPPLVSDLAWSGQRLFVLDERYNRILVLNTAAGGRSPVTLPVPPGTLLGPQGLAVAPNGTIWVADTDHQRLVALTAAGTVKTVIPLHDGVTGVAVLSNGLVAASRYYGGTVVLVNPAGGAVSRLAFTVGAGPDQLNHPTTLVPLANGGFAVWDQGNARAVLVTAEGRPVSWITAPAGATAFTVLPAGDPAWTTDSGLLPIAP